MQVNQKHKCLTVKPELTTTSVWRPPVYIDHNIAVLFSAYRYPRTQRPPVIIGHSFGAPKATVAHRFDCTCFFSEKPSQENEMTLIHHSVLENPVRVCIRGCELVLMSSIHAALQFTRLICITTIIIQFSEFIELRSFV